MLDIHGNVVTPGAVLVLGANPTAALAGNDGQTVPGVPVDPGTAILKMWGGISPTADTIANIKLQTTDLDDQINGVTHTPGAASLLNLWHQFINLDFSKGPRNITMGTNTGVTVGLVYTVDEYPDLKEHCVKGSLLPTKPVATGVTTFGGALTANTWGTVAYAPANPLPVGKYAILGVWVGALANAGLIRFQHADFGAFLPGFPVVNHGTISTSTWDKIFKHEFFLTQQGYQFVYLGQTLGGNYCPVFNAGPQGTGLVIQMAAAQADTPTVILNLARVN